EDLATLLLLVPVLRLQRLGRLELAQVAFAGLEQVEGDAANLGVREVLLLGTEFAFAALVIRQRALRVVLLAEEVGHLRLGPQGARAADPALDPFAVRLLGDAAQAGPVLALLARRVVRVGRQLGALRRREIIQRRVRLQAHVRPDGPAA